MSWSNFLDHAFATRLDPDDFESYCKLLPSSPNAIDVLRDDTRSFQYLERLLNLKLLTPTAILEARLVPLTAKHIKTISVELLRACIRWMYTAEALPVVLAIIEHPQIHKIPPKAQAELSRALEGFIPLVHSPIATKLDLFRAQIAAKDAVDDMLEENLLMVADLPILNTRAGLCIYLNAMLVGRPLVDDIFTCLNNRYAGDLQSTAIDLILAAFDILAMSNKPILRSFLINKVPLLVAAMPVTAEYCITQALAQVDTNAFPTLSGLFDNAIFSDSVRQDFCFSCCLHGLLEESSIQTLLGDIPMQSLPAGGRYLKEDLVQQCLSDPDKTESLLDELDHMDGNVGAVSQAITEVIGRLCADKETMSLKTLCSRLTQKSLDVLLLFDKPITILQPICDLLDNWRYDEDQGEYQPVYEEFGSILLLVLSFVHRFNLSAADLGRPPTSFVAKLLNQGHLSRAMETLTEQEQSHLDGWIRGLFDPDSGGLGDELMSSCPPQDFYLLVPTLFHHIVLACSTNNLSDEGLKGGLEYLVDTFLLPSLVPGITWLSSHLWESRGDANAVLQILSALITKPTISNEEASQMLKSIIRMIAKTLEHSLRWLQRAEPSRQDVEPLSQALRENLTWENNATSDHTELENWCESGLTNSIKTTTIALMQWAVSSSMTPTIYTHRQFLAGIKILGAKRLLDIIINEFKVQTQLGNGSQASDVATALICAPNASESLLQRRMSLREALKIEDDNASRTYKRDPLYAEAVVRLFRRVEAQMAHPPVMMAMDLPSGIGHEALNSDLQVALAENAMAESMELGSGGDLLGGLMGGDLLGGFDDMGDGMGF